MLFTLRKICLIRELCCQDSNLSLCEVYQTWLGELAQKQSTQAIIEGDIYGLPGGHIHRINVVAINERIELCRGGRSFVTSWRQQRQLLTFLELLQVQNWLRVHAHTGQSLEEWNDKLWEERWNKMGRKS